MSRYYVHLGNSSSSLPNHTYVFVLEDENDSKTTITQLINAFCVDYKEKHNLTVEFDNEAIDAILNQVGDDVAVNKLVSTSLEDREDVFVKLKISPPKPKIIKREEIKQEKPGAMQTFNKADLDRLRAQQSSGGNSNITSLLLNANSKVLAEQLTKARELAQQGKLRSARDIYNGVLTAIKTNNSLSQAEKDLITQICEQHCGLIALHNKHFPIAKLHFVTATALAEKAYNKLSEPEQQKQLLEHATLFSLLGQAYFGMKDYDSAEETFEKVEKLLNTADSRKTVQSAIHDNMIWYARTMFLNGDSITRNKAIQLYERVVKENEQHIPGLTYYAKIAVDMDKGLQSVPYLLRALINYQQQSKTNDSNVDPSLKDAICTALADTVSSKQGLEVLISELHTAADSPSALSFIAQTLKDYSAIDTACALYEKALNSKQSTLSERINSLLSLIHTLEVGYKYQEAFEQVKKFFQKNSTLKIQNYNINDFYQAVKDIKDLTDINLKLGTATYCNQYKEIPPIFDEGFCQVLGNSNGSTSINPTTGAIIERKDNQSPNPNIKSYTADELNLLAILFTTVKIFYVQGALQIIPTLVAQLEPLRIDRELHLTIIRNEHAYYSTISQLTRKIQFPLPIERKSKENKIIYICGDSHCLSPAWQPVTVNNQNYILQPKLSTGTKTWHLRPDCRFYTHANYLAAINSIPTGSTVIFVFGEIDCREGLLVSVEKCKYETIEQGMNLCIDVYIKELETITKNKKFQTFIHPIVPVLDVTRAVVKQFNEILVRKLKQSSEYGSGLKYLDFQQDLLCGTNLDSFNLVYGLDGTHMNPKYVQLLQREINKTIANK